MKQDWPWIVHWWSCITRVRYTFLILTRNAWNVPKLYFTTSLSYENNTCTSLKKVLRTKRLLMKSNSLLSTSFCSPTLQKQRVLTFFGGGGRECLSADYLYVSKLTDYEAFNSFCSIVCGHLQWPVRILSIS